MARLRIGDKVERVVGLLMGLRQVRVASTLARYGFTQAELDQGWKYLRQVVGEKLDVTAPTSADPAALGELDRWENRWFPIASATLGHNYPKVYERVFRNLIQTEGMEVIVSVGTFLGRLKELDKSDDESRAARSLLEKRGLTAPVVAQAETLLKALHTVQPAPAVDIEAARKAQAVAEDAMWAWYLEWSTIARTAISDSRLLRSLGFGRPVRRGAAAEDDTDTDGNDTPPAGPEMPGAPGAGNG